MTRPSDAAIAALVEAGSRLKKRMATPGLVKPSTKNANAGFVDMRDWYAIQGNELALLDDALAAIDAEAKNVPAAAGVASEEWKRIPAKLTWAMSDAGKHAMKGTADELSERTRAEIVFWAMVASAPTAVEGRSNG